MKPTFYVDMVKGKLRAVRCMKCNTFLYDIGDAPSVRFALAHGLPKRSPILLNSGSRTDIILCTKCVLVDEDLEKLEATFKFGIMYETIHAGKNKEFIHKIAKWLRDISFVRRLP